MAALPSERQMLSAEIPGLGELPFMRFELQTERRAEADGERLHVRARIQTNLASVMRPLLATSAPPVRNIGTALRLVDRLSDRVQQAGRRALAVPLVRNIAEAAMAFDLNTFVEVQASTASLAGGSRALMPSSDQLARMGVEPDLSPNAAPVQTWAGEQAGGFAQVSLLRLDHEHLPPRLRQLLGDGPFSLSATVVNTAEPSRRAR